MLIKRPTAIAPSEITSRDRYLNRREFMQASAALAAAAGLATAGVWLPRSAHAGTKLPDLRKSALSTTGEELTPYKDVTTYNNYYEFGTGKDDPSETANKLRTRPWSVARRGRGQQAQGVRHRGNPQTGAAGRADLPHALRRGLVDGDTVGRLFVQRDHQARPAHVQGQIRAIHLARRSRADARASGCRSSTGPTRRACAWTKRCIR